MLPVANKASCPLTRPKWNRSVFKKCAPACDNCFASKYGCDRRRPCCSNCARRHITCTYSVRPCGRPSKSNVKNAARVVDALQMAPFTNRVATHGAANRPLTAKQRMRLRARKTEADKLSQIIVSSGGVGALRTKMKQNARATNTLLAKVCIKRKKRPPLPSRRSLLLDEEAMARIVMESPQRKRAKKRSTLREEGEFVSFIAPFGEPDTLTWPEIEVAYSSNRHVDFTNVVIDDRRELLVALIQLVNENYFSTFTANRAHILNNLMRIILRERQAAPAAAMENLATYLSYQDLRGYDALTQFMIHMR